MNQFNYIAPVHAHSASDCQCHENFTVLRSMTLLSAQLPALGHVRVQKTAVAMIILLYLHLGVSQYNGRCSICSSKSTMIDASCDESLSL